MTSMTDNSTVPAGAKAKAANTTLVALFAKAVAAHGERVAVVCGTRRVTYAELDCQARALAARLDAVTPGAIAAIYLERSVEMIPALLATLMRGAAYLPIDPAYPAARVTETLDDARPAVALTTRELAARLPAGIEIVLIDEPGDGSHGVDVYDGNADDVAYIIYTSGSTGKPKGVQVSQRNVVRLLEQTRPWFHFDENDVWTMFHSLAFDFSVWEIWACLLTGGRLVIVPFAVSRSPEDFYLLLADERVTVLNQTPSAFALLMQVEETRPARPLSLRYVIFGGEALYPKRLQTWFERHGDTVPQLVNMYGITETTVHVSYRPITAHDAAVEVDSLIGVPIPDLQIHVLDAEGLPAADGDTGEMYVGGDGVAVGYLNRPALNAERFVADPFVQGSRLYRTGDLARRRADGELVYLGRGDGQVKINGFRIELGEVESALVSVDGIQQSCVTTRPDANDNQRLAAYFVGRGGAAVDVTALKAALAAKLPAHMLPSFYTQIDALPLTGNGKIDRAALPAPVVAMGATRELHGSGTEETIAAAWRAVLRNGDVGLEDNFFDIGGTSLLLIAVRAALQTQMARTIPITWMFESTTVRTLAEKLDASATTGTAKPAGLSAAQMQAQKQRDAFARIRNTIGGAR